ncbi:hypothetical protein PLCT2_00844 [Planctomycetaceae bacterium]|nr:hypothetical protein PLCT2_00844 [Planctomycetaceae bacterium]
MLGFSVDWTVVSIVAAVISAIAAALSWLWSVLASGYAKRANELTVEIHNYQKASDKAKAALSDIDRLPKEIAKRIRLSVLPLDKFVEGFSRVTHQLEGRQHGGAKRGQALDAALGELGDLRDAIDPEQLRTLRQEIGRDENVPPNHAQRFMPAIKDRLLEEWSKRRLDKEFEDGRARLAVMVRDAGLTAADAESRQLAFADEVQAAKVETIQVATQLLFIGHSQKFKEQHAEVVALIAKD